MVEGRSGPELTKTLRDDHSFWMYGNFPGPNDGVYVSPNVFNALRDLDRFSEAVRRIALS